MTFVQKFKKFLKESVKAQKFINRLYGSTFIGKGLYFVQDYLIYLTPFSINYMRFNLEDFELNKIPNDKLVIFWDKEHFNNLLEATEFGEKELVEYLQRSYSPKTLNDPHSCPYIVSIALQYIKDNWKNSQSIELPKSNIKAHYFAIAKNKIAFIDDNLNEIHESTINTDINSKCNMCAYKSALSLLGTKVEMSINKDTTKIKFYNEKLDAGVIGVLSPL